MPLVLAVTAPSYHVVMATRPANSRLKTSTWKHDQHLLQSVHSLNHIPYAIQIQKKDGDEKTAINITGLFPGCSQGREIMRMKDKKAANDYTATLLQSAEKLTGDDLVRAFVQSRIFAKYYGSQGALPGYLKENRDMIVMQTRAEFGKKGIDALTQDVDQAYSLVFKN